MAGQLLARWVYSGPVNAAVKLEILAPAGCVGAILEVKDDVDYNALKSMSYVLLTMK